MQYFGISCSRLIFSLLLLLLAFVVCGKAQCTQPQLGGGVVLAPESQSKDSFPEGSDATITCSEGYVGKPSKITCTGGQWSSPTSTCQKKSCGPPGEILNGHFDIPDGIEFGATVHAACDEGYELVGPGYRQCFSFGWSNNIPTCDVVKCGPPEKIINGKIVIPSEGDHTAYGDVVEYACDKDYTLIGKSQITCSSDGTYKPSLPECKEISCPNPNIAHSIFVEGARPPYRYRHYVIYKCKDGYVMDGTSKLSCTEEGKWSSNPKCIEDKRIPGPEPEPEPESESESEPEPEPEPEPGNGNGNGNGNRNGSGSDNTTIYVICGTIAGIAICAGVGAYFVKRRKGRKFSKVNSEEKDSAQSQPCEYRTGEELLDPNNHTQISESNAFSSTTKSNQTSPV